MRGHVFQTPGGGLTGAELRFLELVADSFIENTLGSWPTLRRVFRKAGAPSDRRLRGAACRAIAADLLVDLGVRPRPDGPLVAVSLRVFTRTWPLARVNL